MKRFAVPLFLAAAIGAGGYAFWEGALRFNTPSMVIYPVRGIDVSHHQGAIDWARVRAAGVSFAYIKATEGGDFRDASYADNWQAARAAGVARGVYHFFSLCTPPEVQIENLVGAVGEPGELPPAIDLELGGNCANPPAKEEVQRSVGDFVKLVTKRLGEPPILYTTYEFRDRYLCPTCVGDKLPLLWIRDVIWRPMLDNKEPWVFWQHHNRGRVDGIEHPVDLDVFRGDVAAFGRYVRDRQLDIVRAK